MSGVSIVSIVSSRSRLAAAALAASVLALAACSQAAGQTSRDAAPEDARSSSASPAAPTQDGDMVDVGGHSLYATCSGTGSPTVVYVHGWVNDPEYVPHQSAYGIRDLLDADYRVCLYDRRNVGSSETVDGVQSPQAMLREMEKVLAGLDAKPPYVLMAASFGGLLAYDFLNHHPGEVEGMVMIDTMFPDELALDRYLPEDATFLHYRRDDKCCTLERISQYEQIAGLQKYIGHEPAVPLVYLASQQEPRDQNDYQSPAYDARIIPTQKAFVARFAPGQFRWVDAPHFMEPVVPDQIAQAVRDVVALAED
jgi:pimeloyl-ACP methyl ester carboxylesterase